LSRKAKVLVIGLFAVILITVSLLPPMPGDRFIWDPQTQPRFVIASWDSSDDYGQGIWKVRFAENSSGSFQYERDYYPSDDYVVNWTSGVGMEIDVYAWFNSTLTKVSNVAEGKKLLRHNITVSTLSGVLWSQENLTYGSCDTTTDPPMWSYDYHVVLGMIPTAGESYFITITYETYYAKNWYYAGVTPGWLSGWTYRQFHVISPSSGAGTNYQVHLNVTRTTGTSSADICYVGTSCQSDFDDIRFTSSDGVTLLDYWKEQYVGNTASFWVEVAANLSTTAQTIYLYYGNSIVSTTSSGPNTFIFFDDFELGTFSRWTSAGSYWSVVDASSAVKMGTYAAYGDAGAIEANRELNKTLSTINYPVMLHMWFRKAVTASAEAIGIFANNTGTMSYVEASNGALGAGTYYTPSWLYYGKAMVLNTWYRYDVGWDRTNSSFQPYIDGVAYSERSARLTTAVVLSQFSQLTVQVQAPTAAYDNWVDDVYIRKWLPSEPQHSSWGPAASWYQAGDDAVLYFITPVDVTVLNGIFILCGLILIPSSTLYLVHGGKDEIDAQRIFVFFLVFLFGWALFLGVIAP